MWSGFTYFSIWAANFQAGRINGEDILFSFEGSHNPLYGHGHGHITVLNQNYETIKELRAGNHRLSDKHEFHIKDEKTGLIQIYQPTAVDLSEWASSRRQQWVVDAIFQELDIETGELLFEWSSLDHVSPSDSVLDVDIGQAGAGFNSSDAWDYFHINSVDKDEHGDYLISARNAASLFKISGKTGEILWKLGGLPSITSSDFQTQNFNFSFQHHARFIESTPEKTVISFFDNSAEGSENRGGSEVRYNSHSSGKIIELDTINWTAKVLFNGVAPDNLLAKSQGSTHVLPNGNVLVNWGSEGAVTEFDSEENPIFHAYLDSGELGEKVQNYRAFRYSWTGIPKEKIALYSEQDKDGVVSLYVSWNGDTQTKTWKFYSIDDANEKTFIGESKRTGFETKYEAPKKFKGKVFVEALDAEDGFLGSSSQVKTVAIIKEISEDLKSSALPTISNKQVFRKFQSYFEWKDLN